jgi:tetratricopeptide (TPR) repeat protein
VTKHMPPAKIPFAVMRSRPETGGPSRTEFGFLDQFRPQAVEPAAPVQKTRKDIEDLYELGRTSAAMCFHELALESIEEVTRLASDHALAWRDYASLLRLGGKDAEAREADMRANEAPADAWPRATGERSADKLTRLDRKMRDRVEAIPDEQRLTWVREHLFENPLDVAAMRCLSFLEDQADDPITARTILERALELSPKNYLDVRGDFVRLLVQQRDHVTCYRETEILLAANPSSVEFRLIRAETTVLLEKFDEAIALFEGLIKDDPEHTNALMGYAAAMKTLGRREESERTYRSILRLVPNNGAAYLGLSDLRSDRLNKADVGDMMEHLAAGIPEIISRKCMAYALAQTLERMKEFEGAAEAYAYAAKVCKDEVQGSSEFIHDPERFETRLGRMRRAFSEHVMRDRMEAPLANPPATTPIFVLGLPRAGSTLTEQILASHPQVEGTRELPSVSSVTKKISHSRVLLSPDAYPDRVPEYSREELHALGEDILRNMAEFRHTTLPYVIDKRPWNWIDIPFLALALPQARFIDIRRAPMAAGFAMYKQMLPMDASFTFDLTHLGKYYRNYVDYMDHLNSIMPGRVLNVRYEDLVDNTEAEIRRMLDYCGLPFDERCLRYWETDRAVLTPSAEQVRKPIYRGALEQWKNFEPWLGELKEALGDLAEA